VWGALDGNLLPQDSKALSFDPGAVRCPHCQSDQIVKRGKTARGTQRYLCQNTLCAKGSFLLDYCNRGCLPEVKQTIIDMSLNASGVRDTARSLHICPNTVLRELKKKETALELVNTALLRTLNPAEVAWDHVTEDPPLVLRDRHHHTVRGLGDVVGDIGEGEVLCHS